MLLIRYCYLPLPLSLSLSLSCEGIGKKNTNDVRCGALQRPLLLVKVIILFCDQQVFFGGEGGVLGEGASKQRI